MQDMQKIKDNIVISCLKKRILWMKQWLKKECKRSFLQDIDKKLAILMPQKIFWDKIDRRFIPAKYDGIIFNSKVIKLAGIYRNAEIVDNIHFSS